MGGWRLWGFFLVLTFSQKNAWATQDQTLRRGGAVILFNELMIEKGAYSPVASLVLKFYHDGFKLLPGKNIIWQDGGGAQKWARQNVAPRLIPLLKRNDVVDIFVFGHSNRAEAFLLSGVPDHLIRKIRMVYNSGCEDGGRYSAEEWLRLGVHSFVGHAKVSWSPLFLPRFLKNWFFGLQLGDSVSFANRELYSDPILAPLALMGLKKPIQGTMAEFYGNGLLSF